MKKLLPSGPQKYLVKGRSTGFCIYPIEDTMMEIFSLKMGYLKPR
jgi:hypothetical protein